MAGFIRVLCIWPISISIAENLPFGDLLKLSRVNSNCRCALHGFPLLTAPESMPPKQNVRSNLYIGEHQTSYWKGLKRASIRECSEQGHTRGATPQCCRRCSMPVCEACVVKENYKKNEPTFKNRCRYLCVDCWTFGNLHVGRHSTAPSPNPALSYNFAPGSGDFCVCTVKDGWLCRNCKNEQNAEARNITKCAGEACENFLEEEKESRRICLWCDFPLIKRHHRSENRDPRKDYNFGFIFEGNTVEEDDPNRNTEEWNKRREGRTRLTSVENRRIERLLQPDDTGAQYVRHLAEVDYRAFGAKRPSRRRVTDSMHGVFKYDDDFLVQFRDICTKEPSEDWWVWMVRLMAGEEGEGCTAKNISDEVGGTGCVKGKKGKKRKNRDNKDDDSISTSVWKGKRPEEPDVENQRDMELPGHDPLCQNNGGPDVLNHLPPTNVQDDGYFIVGSGQASETIEDRLRQDPTVGGRTGLGPEEKPPDYDMCEDDLLLELDGPSNV